MENKIAQFILLPVTAFTKPQARTPYLQGIISGFDHGLAVSDSFGFEIRAAISTRVPGTVPRNANAPFLTRKRFLDRRSNPNFTPTLFNEKSMLRDEDMTHRSAILLYQLPSIDRTQTEINRAQHKNTNCLTWIHLILHDKILPCPTLCKK